MSMEIGCKFGVEFQIGKYKNGEVEWMGEPTHNFITDWGLKTLKHTYFADMTRFVYLGDGTIGLDNNINVTACSLSGFFIGEVGGCTTTETEDVANIGKTIIFNNGAEAQITSVSPGGYIVLLTKQYANFTGFIGTATIPVDSSATLSSPLAVSSLCDTAPGTVQNIKRVDSTTSIVTITNTRSIIFPPETADITYREIAWSNNNTNGLASNMFGRKAITKTFNAGDMPYIRVSIVRIVDCSEQTGVTNPVSNAAGTVSTKLLLDLPEFNEDYYSTIDADGSLIPPVVVNTMFEAHNKNSENFNIVASNHAKDLTNSNSNIWDEDSVFTSQGLSVIKDVIMWDDSTYLVVTTLSILVFNKSNVGVWSQTGSLAIIDNIPENNSAITKVYKPFSVIGADNNIAVATGDGLFIIDVGDGQVPTFTLRKYLITRGACIDVLNYGGDIIALFADNTIIGDYVGQSESGVMDINDEVTVTGAVSLTPCSAGRFIVGKSNSTFELWSYSSAGSQVTAFTNISFSMFNSVDAIYNVDVDGVNSLYLVIQSGAVTVVMIQGDVITKLDAIPIEVFPLTSPSNIVQINRTTFLNTVDSKLYRFAIVTKTFTSSVPFVNTNFLSEADTGVDASTIRAYYNSGAGADEIRISDIPLNIQDATEPKDILTATNLLDNISYSYDNAAYVGDGYVIAVAGSKVELITYDNGTMVSTSSVVDLPQTINSVHGIDNTHIIAVSSFKVYLLKITVNVLSSISDASFVSIEKAMVLSSGHIVIANDTNITSLYTVIGTSLVYQISTTDFHSAKMNHEGMELNEGLYPARFYLSTDGVNLKSIDVSTDTFVEVETISSVDVALSSPTNVIQELFVNIGVVYARSTQGTCYPIAITSSGMIRIPQAIGLASNFVALSDTLLENPPGPNPQWKKHAFNGKDANIVNGLKTLQLNTAIQLPNDGLLTINDDGELLTYTNLDSDIYASGVFADVDFLHSNMVELKSIMVVPSQTGYTESVQLACVFDTPITLDNGRISGLEVSTKWYRELV